MHPDFGGRRPRRSWPVACLALVLLLPRPAVAAEGTASIVLPQAGGDELVLEAPAGKIVALSPHLTELVFAAGAGHLLAATVAYSDFPPEAANLPRVGDAFRIDVERVQLLAPDLILAWQSGNLPGAVSHLAELGFRVWTVEIRRPEEIAVALEQIGRAAGTEDAAYAAAHDLRARIAGLQARYSERGPVSYFYQVAEQPLYTVNGDHLISRGLSYCGGRNVFSDLPALAPQVALEAVLLADPRLLIAPRVEGQDNPLEHWRSWPRLQAVRGENFLLLAGDEISRATPRFLDVVELACAMMDDLRSSSR